MLEMLQLFNVSCEIIRLDHAPLDQALFVKHYYDIRGVTLENYKMQHAICQSGIFVRQPNLTSHTCFGKKKFINKDLLECAVDGTHPRFQRSILMLLIA